MVIRSRRGTSGLLLFFLLPFPVCIAARAEDGATWIVVTAPALRASIEPLCEHRRMEGYRVVILQTTDVLDPGKIRCGDGSPLKDHLGKLCVDVRGKVSVLLVGAVRPPDPDRNSTPERDPDAADPLPATRVRVDVERPFGSVLPDAGPIPEEAGEARDAALLARHERANALAIESREVVPADGRFECTFRLPDALPWPRVIVRAQAEAGGEAALGVLTVEVVP